MASKFGVLCASSTIDGCVTKNSKTKCGKQCGELKSFFFLFFDLKKTLFKKFVEPRNALAAHQVVVSLKDYAHCEGLHLMWTIFYYQIAK